MKEGEGKIPLFTFDEQQEKERGAAEEISTKPMHIE